MVVRVEFDPMLVLELLSVLVLLADDGAFLFFVGPVPERNSLGTVSTQSNDVAVVHRQVNGLNTIRVRIEVGTHRCTRDRIPDHEH